MSQFIRSQDEIARIFGEVFCEEAAKFPQDDPRRVRAGYKNWSIHQQRNLDFGEKYSYPGAWMISFDRSDENIPELGILANTLIKATGRFRSSLNYLQCGCSLDVIQKFARKCANLCLKEPLGYCMDSRFQVNCVNTNNETLEELQELENLRQATQFYWDTCKNFEEYSDKTWSRDYVYKLLFHQHHVIDIIWVPNTGLMVEFEGGFRPEVNGKVSEEISSLLMTAGMFMLEYVRHKQTILTDENVSTEMKDEVLVTYIKMQLYAAVKSKMKYVRPGEQYDFLVNLPDIPVKEFLKRVRECPDKKETILEEYFKVKDETSQIMRYLIQQLMNID